MASVPTLPAGSTTSPLADLYEEDPDPRPSRKKPRARPGAEDSSSTTRTLIGSSAAIVAVLGIWLLIRSLSSDPVDPVAAHSTDAGAPVTVDSGSTRRPLARTIPDAGTKAKPVRLLSVISTPSGATVEMDGGYIGQTPLVMKHDFKMRYYQLTVLKEGYARWETRVRPNPDLGTINVMAILKKDSDPR